MNGFVHQDYDQPPPQGDFKLLAPKPSDQVDDNQPLDHPLAPTLQQIAAAGVRTILLVRGTFVGADAWGMARKLSRVWPRGAVRLREGVRQAVDAIAGNYGNFCDEDIQELRAAANAAKVDIAIDCVQWSGENHHAGRADGAVRLMQRIAQHFAEHPTSRVLTVAHSHGGNVAALASQLWCCEENLWNDFLNAARNIYRSPVNLFGWRPFPHIDQPVWTWALDRSETPAFPADLCDLVTLGCPVRYGWGPHGHLAHFIHHVIVDAENPWRATFPPRAPADSPTGCEGDIVQQIGIAGTNFPISWFSYRTRVANYRLRCLLQPDLRRRDLLPRLRRAVRLHDQGLNLLTNYSDVDPAAKLVLGHAVYTRRRWLPFHFQQIATELYQQGAERESLTR